jgi:hypothetical protein
MEIVITGTSMSVEEGHRAQKASTSDLPALTTEQKAVAKGFGISEEQYARMELARRYGEERLQKAAHAMAHIIQGEFSKLAPGAELRTLLYAVGLEPHRIMVAYKGKDHTFKIPSDDESGDYVRELSKRIADDLLKA